MAATTPAFPVSGGVLVVATTAFMPPRLLLAPAGAARLPRGVHAAVAFPAAPVAAAPGSGRRGAMRLVVAASAGSEAAGDADGSGDDYDKQMEELSPLDLGKVEVILSWDDFELRRTIYEDNVPYEAYEMVCFDRHAVGKLQMNAWRGVKLVESLLIDLGPQGTWEADLNDLKVAGMCFRLFALEAQRGYVRASSVREAAHKLAPLYAAILSHRSARPALADPLPAAKFHLDDAPSPMLDPSGYYKGLTESIEKAINAVESAFVRKRCGHL